VHWYASTPAGGETNCDELVTHTFKRFNYCFQFGGGFVIAEFGKFERSSAVEFNDVRFCMLAQFLPVRAAEDVGASVLEYLEQERIRFEDGCFYSAKITEAGCWSGRHGKFFV